MENTENNIYCFDFIPNEILDIIIPESIDSLNDYGNVQKVNKAFKEAVERNQRKLLIKLKSKIEKNFKNVTFTCFYNPTNVPSCCKELEKKFNTLPNPLKKNISTLFLKACENGHVHFVDVLLKTEKINLEGKDFQALEKAVQYGKTEVVIRLLKENSKIDSKKFQGLIFSCYQSRNDFLADILTRKIKKVSAP